MIVLAHSASMLGIDGYIVRVEADSAAGTPSFGLIGLPDRALNEARDRVRAAVVNSGYPFPAGRVLVNLAPAHIRKVGPGFDLPIALALLGVDGHVDTLALQRFVALGELALDGSVRPTRGVLPVAIAARNACFDALLVPCANAREAALVEGIAPSTASLRCTTPLRSCLGTGLSSAIPATLQRRPPSRSCRATSATYAVKASPSARLRLRQRAATM